MKRSKNFYATLEEASLAAQRLNIVTSQEYQRRYKEDQRLPSNPNSTYKSEWQGWRQFLGGGRLYQSYQEAAHATQRLKIGTSLEYSSRYKEDPKLPCSPQKKYKEQWAGWKHFLGDYYWPSKHYRTYQEASQAAQRLKIKTSPEYHSRYKEDPKLPCSPQTMYKEQWAGWKHFLGDYYWPSKHYRTYQEASQAAQRLKIKTSPEYHSRYKEDSQLPSHPNIKYQSDWQGWPNFLGQNIVDHHSSDEAKLKQLSEIAQNLGIHTCYEYHKKCKNIPDLVSRPDLAYKAAWISWKDFLGPQHKSIPVKTTNNQYSTYEEASLAAQKLQIKTSSEYTKMYKSDPRLPYSPKTLYENDWIDWKHFLNIYRFYCSYEEASLAAQKLQIKTSSEYDKMYKSDPRLPSNPRRFYKDKWMGSKHFFAAGKYQTYEEASIAAQKLQINTPSEYTKMYKSDPRLPSNPRRSYKDKWVSWQHFLGTEKQRHATYQEASDAAQALGIKTSMEYNKRYKEDPQLPSTPRRSYKDKWVSWPHFLGKE